MEAIPAYRRWRIVEAVQEGQSVAEAAERFAVSETSVRNDRQQLNEIGSLEPKPPSGGPEPELDDDERRRLREAVDDQPDATLAELIKARELDVSPSTVRRELQKLDRSRKRKVPRAAERHERDIRRQRVRWLEQIADIDPHRLIYVDEAGVFTNMTRLYGRAPAGEPVYTDTPHRRYETLTVLGGVRLGGAGEPPTLAYPGGTTTERMVEYVVGPLGEVLRPGDIVAADKLPARKAKRVSEALAERGAEIQLLPPYSPDLNPIERLWSKIKTHLRAAQKTTVPRLRAALDDALSTVANRDIRR